ncbi:MAG: lysophospholipid acyltransferase family protein [Phycisphaeraceae bacterium]
MSRGGDVGGRWTPDHRSAWMFDKFAATSVHLVAGTFGEVRVLRPPAAGLADRPLILASNHPSWWDPMVGLVTLLRYLPERVPFVPIDPKGYREHPVFARVGFFPLEPASSRGAVSLLRDGRKALGFPGGLVWITPEGRFTDPRVRPLQLRPGAAALALRTPGAVLVPVAIEYRFGAEPKPEAYLSYGEPIETCGASVDHVVDHLSDALAGTMDELAHVVQEGDVERCELILRGNSGSAAGLWNLLRAYTRGPTAYDPAHLQGSD